MTAGELLEHLDDLIELAESEEHHDFAGELRAARVLIVARGLASTHRSDQSMSARSCGCDAGASWTCEEHREDSAPK